LYLLDDPLSAVDAKVAHILYETILNLAVARNKCVILVTHQLHFVKSSACVLLDKGKIVANGTFTHCVKASHDGFLHHLANVKETNQESSDATDRVNAETYQEGETEDKGTEIEKYQEKEPHPIRQHTNKKDEDQAEERHVGIITMKTWRSYGQALGGIAIAFLIIFLFVISQTSLLLTIVFLGKWAEASIETQPSRFWLSLILSTTGGVVILAIIRAQAMFYFSIKASQQLHNRMLASVLRAKIEFFDTNPLGRILNRFSADVGIIDETFPFTLHDFLVGFFVVLGSIATVGVALPFCLLVLPPLLWYFTRLRRIFVSTTRELKRIEGIARSPIYAMVSESLQGVATIRTNGKVDYFLSKFERAHDSHTRAYFAFILSSRWFAFQLDILSFVLMSTTSIFSVLFHDQGWFNVEPATLGLALTLLIQISTTNLPWIVRQSAEVSNHMVSVERIVTYASLPSEAPLTTNLDKEFERWPEETSIEVKDLKVRYRANLPLVLNNVTFGVKSGHRIGIVGRTGAGKSTIAQTFFRILEPESGCIKVGGVDISLLGLHKLRNNMAVIPQSPVLFSGYTVHENLDPFGKRSEDEIMHALGCVRMREAVNSLPLGVDTPVAEGGINFSVGQRQLLCLARSILSNCKILILDEPTANIDAQSDQLLQQTLRDDQFADRTIVMVAHRLQTVVNFDSILVLGNGKVLEFGPPAELLAKKDGHFASMMQSTRTQESI
jgi:ATP-binding cassette subfamily C (CFTR/MRP) protein 4